MTDHMSRSETSDRQIHAERPNGQIVRYDRAGAWYVEWKDTRTRSRLSVREAAKLALMWTVDSGVVNFGLPGGSTFDRLVRGKS